MLRYNAHSSRKREGETQLRPIEIILADKREYSFIVSVPSPAAVSFRNRAFKRQQFSALTSHTNLRIQ